LPDHRLHRGSHPEDGKLFAPAVWPALRAAVGDLSWLLTRGYAQPSALKIVGDRYELTARQRLAVMRSACSDQALQSRKTREIRPANVAGRVLIDGYNVLTTIEAALSGAVLLIGRDGTLRDIAGVHGTYRKVEETPPAIHLIGNAIAQLRAREAVWYLDAPVSNSGRLKGVLQEIAKEKKWPWTIEIVPNPDPILAAANECVCSADSVILDQCKSWFSLARYVVSEMIPGANVVDLETNAKE